MACMAEVNGVALCLDGCMAKGISALAVVQINEGRKLGFFFGRREPGKDRRKEEKEIEKARSKGERG